MKITSTQQQQSGFTIETPANLAPRHANSLYLDADNDIVLVIFNGTDDKVGAFRISKDSSQFVPNSVNWPLRQAPAGFTITLTQE